MIIFSNTNDNQRAAELAGLRLAVEANTEEMVAYFVSKGVSYKPLSESYLYVPEQFHHAIRERFDDPEYVVIFLPQSDEYEEFTYC